MGGRAAALRTGAREGVRAIATLTEPAVALPHDPYPGIRPFRYADRAIFFARAEETERLADLVSVYRGVLLYGDSGAGKSSLINAGLCPLLVARGVIPERIRLQPRKGAELVIEQLEAGDAEQTLISIESFKRHVADTLKRHQALFIFDQFEELVTLFDGAPELRRRLTSLLTELLHGELPVRLVLGFRDDYLGRIKELLAHCPELVDQSLRLAPPPLDALETIVSEPFERYPEQFDHPLPAAVRTDLVQALSKRFGSGEVSLSEVQIVCLRLWQSDNPGALLEAKGPQGLLEDYLGASLEQLPAGLRAAAIALLSHMVTAAGTRNVIAAEDLFARVRADGGRQTDPQLRDALAALGRARLVRVEPRRDLELYELTSEFLVPWISARREQLERDRWRKRLILLGAAAFVLLLVVVGVVVLAVFALKQRSDARHQATAARSLALAAYAQASESQDPDAALQLALAAVQPYASAGAAPETSRAAMVSALEPDLREGVIGTLRAAGGAVDAVAFAPRSALLAIGRQDGDVQLWNLGTHRLIGVLAGHAGSIDSLAFSPDGRELATGGSRGSVIVWRVGERRAQARFGLGRNVTVTSLAFSPSAGRVLAAGGSDMAVRLFTARAGAWSVPVTLTPAAFGARVADEFIGGYSPGVTGLAFTQDGSRLIVGLGASDAGTVDRVVVWNLGERRPSGRPINPHANEIGGLAVSPGGGTLAIADSDNVELVSLKSGGGARTTFAESAAALGGIAFTPSGDQIAETDTYRGVQIWKLSSDRANRPSRARPFAAMSLAQDTAPPIAFDPTGTVLAIGLSDGDVRLWRPGGPPALGPRDSHAVIAFSPDNRTLAAGYSSGVVRVFSTADGTQVARLPSPDGGAIAALAFNRSGTRLLVATRRGVAVVWRVPGFKRVVSYRSLSRAGSQFAVDPNLGMVAIPSGRTVRLRSVAGRPIRSLAAPAGVALGNAAFSPDGTELAAADENSAAVFVWKLTGESHRPVELTAAQSVQFRAATTQDVAFGPGGRVAAIADDGSVHVWSVANHRQLGPTLYAGPGGTTYPLIYKDQSYSGMTLAFSADGRTLVTDAPGSVQLWDLATLHPLGRRSVLPEPPGSSSVVTETSPGLRGSFSNFTTELPTAQDAVFSPDGSMLATTGRDGVQLWHDVVWSGARDLKREVCGLIEAPLTRSEWTKYAPELAYERPCG